MSNGYFEAYVNAHAYHRTPADGVLLETIGTAARCVLPRAQIHRGGSTEQGTGIEGSDMDLWLAPLDRDPPVTAAERRAIRDAVATETKRTTNVKHHVVRVESPGQGCPKVDLSFTRADFGSRPLSDTAPFAERRERGFAVRALKLWTRGAELPPVRGWAAEGIVLQLDRQTERVLPLELFLKTIRWLATATSADVEAILRPRAQPVWHPAWSAGLPGALEAIANRARSLLSRDLARDPFRTPADVEAWLRVGPRR